MQHTEVERFDTTATIVVVMNRDEAERAEYEIVTTGTRLRGLLVDFYERRGWAALGFSSWRAWAVARIGDSQARAYQELTAGLIEQQISTNVETPIGTLPESHLRPLAALKDDPDKLREAWQEAHELAEQRGEKLTAKHVTEAVKAIMPPPPAPPMAVHFSSASAEWYTPPHILAAARQVLGAIDCDPASAQEAQRTVQASEWCGLDHPDSARRDGLAVGWHGRVWLNPPYGDVIGDWLARLVHQVDMGNTTEAIALVPARTDTAWFQEATTDRAGCFVRGRLKFGNAENGAPFPSALIYFGDDDDAFLNVFSELGDVRSPQVQAQPAAWAADAPNFFAQYQFKAERAGIGLVQQGNRYELTYQGASTTKDWEATRSFIDQHYYHLIEREKAAELEAKIDAAGITVESVIRPAPAVFLPNPPTIEPADDAPLTAGDLLQLSKAGYTPAGGGAYGPHGKEVLYFNGPNRVESGSRAYWRGIIANLPQPQPDAPRPLSPPRTIDAGLEAIHSARRKLDGMYPDLTTAKGREQLRQAAEDLVAAIDRYTPPVAAAPAAAPARAITLTVADEPIHTFVEHHEPDEVRWARAGIEALGGMLHVVDDDTYIPLMPWESSQDIARYAALDSEDTLNWIGFDATVVVADRWSKADLPLTWPTGITPISRTFEDAQLLAQLLVLLGMAEVGRPDVRKRDLIIMMQNLAPVVNDATFDTLGSRIAKLP